MSIELKQAAEKALVVLVSATSFMSRKARDQHESVVAELRAAIQQAEAQQPATGEPVAWIRRHPNGALSNELLIHVQVEQVRRDSGAWVPLYTHPAPSAPGDVARDAERYRFIRDADVSDDLIPDIALYAMESLDEYIDAARLADKKGGAA